MFIRKKYLLILFIFIFLIFHVNCREDKDKDNKIIISKEKIKIKKKKVTFIELGSVKCIPCKAMQPIMDEIEEEYKDTVEVIFYDVWTVEGRPYAEKYKIRAIPTQIFLDENGVEYYRHEGFFPKEELVKILEMKIK